MIDIHCHILPSSDDGVSSVGEAMTMARIASASGVSAVVITPHCNLPDAALDNYVSMDLLKRMKTFRDRVKAAGNKLRLLPGAEIFYTPEVPALLKKGLLPRLCGTDYLVVEFYFDAAPETIRDGLNAIRAEGCIPVLAHPERYFAVQDTPFLADDWVKSGSVMQINKGSLFGDFGKRSYRAAQWLLQNGMAHVIASDAHSASSRTPDLASVYDLIEETYDTLYADLLLEENPGRIINNQPILRAE